MEFLFYVSKAVLIHRTFPWTEVPSYHAQCTYAVAWTTKTLLHPGLCTLLLGFLFVLLSKMKAFASTALPFSTTVWTAKGERRSSLGMSARFHFRSRFTTTKSQVPCSLKTGFASSWSWFWETQNGNPARAPKTSGTMQMARREGRNKGRVTKLCWLAPCPSSGCQLFLELLPYLEGTVKYFRHMNQDVSSAVIVSQNTKSKPHPKKCHSRTPTVKSRWYVSGRYVFSFTPQI